MQGVDTKAIKRLATVRGCPPESIKFCDWKLCATVAVQRVQHLGLNRGTQLRILDVGCAFGYFVRACCQLGHNASGLDMDHPVYNDACELLGVPVARHHVRARQPLPESVAGFDLINAVGFGRPSRPANKPADRECLWSDWAFFVDDLLDRLNPNGQLAFELNFGGHPHHEGDRWNRAFGLRANIIHNQNRFALEKR